MKKIGSLIFCLLLPVFAFAQAKVSLSVNEEEVAVGDYITVVIEVNADKNVAIEPPKMPAFADLEIRDQSTQVSDSVSIINGEYKFVRVNRFIYMYQTTTKGDLDIPPIEVVIDGKAYRTNGKKIRVVDAANVSTQQRQRGQPGTQRSVDPFQNTIDEFEDMYQQLLRRRAPRIGDVKAINPNESFAVRLELDKTRAYVGEQVTASYYIYVSDAVVLRSIDTLKFPSLNNFWKEDIEISTRLNFEPAQINGKGYKRALLASYALFPIKHGSLKVDSYKVKGGIAAQSMFGMGKVNTYTKASDEISVNVLPLPDANRPADFTGVVGDFQVEAKIEEERFKTGQPFTLKLKVAGRGNAKVIELPSLNLPASLELFDKKEEAKYFPNGQSYKEFSLYITPKEVGSLTIPPITFTYFDASRSQYMQRSSAAMTIQVEQGDMVSPSHRPLLAVDEPKGNQPPSLSAALAVDTQWLDDYSFWLFTILIVFTLVFFIYRLRRDLKTDHYAKIFVAKSKRRLTKIKALVAKEDYKIFAIESLNYLYFLISEISGEEGDLERLQKSIGLLPISLRKEVESDILSVIDSLQALAFAPEELTKEIRNKKKISETYKLVQSIGEKLIKYKVQQENI